MSTAPERLTRKQSALVKALADPSVKTVTEAAERAGMVRTSAHRALRNESVVSALTQLQAKRGDTARSIASRALHRAARAVDSPDADPVTDVQVAMGTISVAEKYAAAFETPDSEEQRASEAAAKRVLLKRALVAGVLVAIRAAKRGKSPDELRAWARDYLLDHNI